MNVQFIPYYTTATLLFVKCFLKKKIRGPGTGGVKHEK